MNLTSLSKQARQHCMHRRIHLIVVCSFNFPSLCSIYTKQALINCDDEEHDVLNTDITIVRGEAGID